MLRFDSAMFDELIDQLLNGLPAVGSFEFCDDLFFGEEISQLHNVRPARNPGSV